MMKHLNSDSDFVGSLITSVLKICMKDGVKPIRCVCTSSYVIQFMPDYFLAGCLLFPALTLC